MKISHKFVHSIPEVIDDNTIYISIKYKTAIHKCACGCGEEVVTPLSPSGWSLNYNGKSISLSPSIGNWSFDCRSHYWIQNDTIKWAGDISKSTSKKIIKRDSDDIIKTYKDKSFWSKLKDLFNL
jgi:hypothetical protein